LERPRVERLGPWIPRRCGLASNAPQSKARSAVRRTWWKHGGSSGHHRDRAPGSWCAAEEPLRREPANAPPAVDLAWRAPNREFAAPGVDGLWRKRGIAPAHAHPCIGADHDRIDPLERNRPQCVERLAEQRAVRSAGAGATHRDKHRVLRRGRLRDPPGRRPRWLRRPTGARKPLPHRNLGKRATLVAVSERRHVEHHPFVARPPRLGDLVSSLELLDEPAGVGVDARCKPAGHLEAADPALDLHIDPRAR